MDANVDETKDKSDCSSPASTPSSYGEEKFLVPFQIRPKVKRKWYEFRNVPFAIIGVSLIQITFHIVSTPDLIKLLRFEPRNRHQIHRFVTYMLIHDDWHHLALNVVIQCLLAAILERRQGRLRVLIIYSVGGVTGVMGASCVQPDLVIGASAGVYALLISNVADIMLNYSAINYKLYRISSITILVIFDIIYNVVHVYLRKEPIISWAAHCTGGVAGLLLGFVVYRSNTEKTIVVRTLFWWGLFGYIMLFLTFVLLTVQISRCTPVDVMQFRYVYFC